MIERGESAVTELTELSEEDRQSEAIFLKLRLDEGVQLNEHRERFGVDIRIRYAAEIEKLGAAGLIEIDPDNMRISKYGKILANEVFAAFI